MDMKFGLKHPDPSLIRLYINKMILDITEKEIAAAEPGERPKYTFGAKAIQQIDIAINNACVDFDKHGIFAGIIDKDRVDG